MSVIPQRVRGGIWLKGILGLLCTVAVTCSAQKAPATPDRPWDSSGQHLAKDIARNPSSEIVTDPSKTYSLGELIDLAEEHNPQTRFAWAAAKRRAAEVGIARSDMYPTLEGLVVAERSRNGVLINQGFVLQDLGLYQATLKLTYTLLDFGARQSSIDTAKANLLAADYAFNDTHLAIIYRITQAYYRLEKAQGQRAAAEANLQNAQGVQQAAEARLKLGLATLPDVLEARSGSAQAEYDLQTAIGAQDVAFGDLATALTASPVAPFKVQSLDDIAVPEKVDDTAEEAIERALAGRPDLLQRVAQVRSANAAVRHARSAFYPSLSFDGSDSFLRAWGQQPPFPSSYAGAQVYDARLNLNWTIFDGGKRVKELARAKAEQKSAQAELNETRDQIADQVWTAYSDAETAFRQRAAATSLLQASNESFNAAIESYKYGVRNLLDVLSAQKTLAQARSADVTARAQVLTRVAELAFRTGDLLRQSGRKPGP
ncbi:TolC family type I secretion outer membrane protein [Acidipila rosea]|uniref:TolC family type I secretion outer membrane protein n=1 Tax=Acidipila rosea TaxID=768535 RepID=A0A4R1L634_9BACT|nr:TolC family type I secretion outer membrane protein [Acidipila rosea]